MRRGDSDVNFGQSGPGDLNCICKIDDKISICICRIDYKISLWNLNFLPSVDEVGPVLNQSCTQLLLLVSIWSWEEFQNAINVNFFTSQ